MSTEVIISETLSSTFTFINYDVTLCSDAKSIEPGI